MASYSVNRAKHATLSANSVDTVRLLTRNSGVEVINRSASDTIYVRFSGTPTVAGDDSIVVMPGSIYVKLSPADTVKLISSGTPEYSVQGVE
jgi:hypothetical protein